MNGICVRGPNGEEIGEGQGILVYDKIADDFKVITSAGGVYELPKSFHWEGEDLTYKKHQHKIIPIKGMRLFNVLTEEMEVL